MKFKDVQTMSKEDLQKKKKDLELQLMKERGQIANGTSPKSPGGVRNIRRDLAKINQVLKE